LGQYQYPQLRVKAQQHGIFFGSAANYYAIYQNGNNNDRINYTETLGYQFSLVTPENSMKWAATEPQRGVFTFQQGDGIVAFARQNGQTVRGHNLCWGQYNPSWLTNGGFSPSQLQSILQNHIQTVVSHYKGLGGLYSWDVVNEAVSDNPSSNNIFKTNIWYPAIPNYVDLAFTYARAADPTIKLFYNDYWIANNDAKSMAVYDMIKSMKSRGIPIDGVGFEMHVSTNAYQSQQQVIQAIQRYAALGIEVHITEMDVGINSLNTQQLTEQASIYQQILQACLQNSQTCKNFEVWGFTDAHSWLSSEYADIFYSDYVAKPAFYSLYGAM